MPVSSRRGSASTRVLDATMPSVRIERGSAKLPQTERVAIIASYGPNDSVSTSLPTLTAEFERNGYTVIIVRASEDDRPLRWPDAPSTNPTIVRRSNIGYDFGSWAVGLALFPAIRNKPFVILANDSLVGPFASLTPLIESFEASTSDVWGATNTTQFFAHIQSFFVGYRCGILSDPALRQFWSELEIETDKRMIIQRYELGLSQLLFAEGLTTSACFESERTVMAGQNPTMHGWKNLIQCGFPFVKRELLTNPAVVPDGNTVPAVVQNHFGVDPRDWL